MDGSGRFHSENSTMMVSFASSFVQYVIRPRKEIFRRSLGGFVLETRLAMPKRSSRRMTKKRFLRLLPPAARANLPLTMIATSSKLCTEKR
jgi:hypothetical protein